MIQNINRCTPQPECFESDLRETTLKALQIVLDFPPSSVGGIEVHVCHLAEELSKLGIECTVIHGGATKSLTGHKEKRKARREWPGQTFRVEEVTSLNLLGKSSCFMPSLPYCIRDKKPDIIHAHGYWNLYAIEAGLMGFLSKVPRILTVHGIGDYRSMSNLGKKTVLFTYDKTLGRASLSLYSRFIAVSNDVKRDVIARGVSAQKVAVIPNGVELDDYARKPAEVSNHNCPIIMCCGRLDESKGYQFMIKAMPLIIKRVGRIKLVLIGADVGYRKHLSKLVRDLHLGSHVEFAGYIPKEEKIRILQSATVVVVPSLREPFGLIVLEAMAAGIPLVATKAGGIVDIVDSENALLVPAGDSGSLAREIIRVLTDEGLRRKLICNAKSSVKNFNWSSVAQRTRDIYNCLA